MFALQGKKMKALSARQERILNFIRGFQRKWGFPPSIRDIVKGCEISSTSVANYNLNLLEKMGYLRRHHEVSRGIELLDRGVVKHLVPLIGEIAAGKPIPVPNSDTFSTVATDTIEVTDDLARGQKDIYALRVKGTSMIDELINDGDIVLLQTANTVENGETAAVWLRQEKEVTLKKVYLEGGRLRLQPANSQMKPIYTAPANVEIQGRLVAVIRQL
ncbi:MAG: transcriptional repressor LexA [Chloroflexota bacterium]